MLINIYVLNLLSRYKGEIGFFDFYIIPLAKKLKECGVFGVSSGEYLDYAMKNRAEWAQRGEQVVEDMLAKYNARHPGVERSKAVVLDV